MGFRCVKRLIISDEETRVSWVMEMHGGGDGVIDPRYPWIAPSHEKTWAGIVVVERLHPVDFGR